jgi:hypothetical protein
LGIVVRAVVARQSWTVLPPTMKLSKPWTVWLLLKYGNSSRNKKHSLDKMIAKLDYENICKNKAWFHPVNKISQDKLTHTYSNLRSATNSKN